MRTTASEAMENYLEAILVLSESKPEIHAVDICAFLSYSRPTVSVMLRQMRECGFIEVDQNNHVWLTRKGREIAEHIYERHTILSKLFMSLGVDEKTAQQDACKVEHDLSDLTFDKIKQQVRHCEMCIGRTEGSV